jgi:hypothetical protein
MEGMLFQPDAQLQKQLSQAPQHVFSDLPNALLL